MSSQSHDARVGIAGLDPNVSQAVRRDVEVQRPAPQRRIDCDGNPEIVDRRRVARGPNVGRPWRGPISDS